MFVNKHVHLLIIFVYLNISEKAKTYYLDSRNNFTIVNVQIFFGYFYVLKWLASFFSNSTIP